MPRVREQQQAQEGEQGGEELTAVHGWRSMTPAPVEQVFCEPRSTKTGTKGRAAPPPAGAETCVACSSMLRVATRRPMP